MKKREFNALLKKITTNKKIDTNKISTNLTDDERKRMVVELVRMRAPIVVELIPEQLDKPFDMSWLYSCGYFHIKRNDSYKFLCTDEQAIHLKLT